MRTKTKFEDLFAGNEFAVPFHPLAVILRRTEPEQLDEIKELLDLQAGRNGRPIVVLPRNPDTTH